MATNVQNAKISSSSFAPSRQGVRSEPGPSLMGSFRCMFRCRWASQGAVHYTVVQLVVWVKQNRPSKRLMSQGATKQMKKTITAVAVLALGASLAFAGPHGEGKRGRHGKGGWSSASVSRRS